MDKDFSIANEKLYTVREAAKICGVGRTTLLRLEEIGFDRARKVDPDSGYRYYDVVNIHRIMQYQMLRQLGLSMEEITEYYHHRMDAEAFLQTLKERLAIAERCVDEFESRFSARESLTYQFYTLPAVTCAVFKDPFPNPKDQIDFNYRKIQELYDKGFRPFPTTPMFSAQPDIEHVYDGTDPEPFEMSICVTIYPDRVPDPSIVAHFTERPAFSLLYHGNRDEIMKNGGKYLLEEMKRRDLTPAGPLYGICVVGPFFGTDIDPDDYVFRWAIPIA